MSFQYQLFDLDYSFLPQPFESETLYSWSARFHRLSTNSKSNLTSKQLFKHLSAGFRHDFPTHLNTFSEVTNQIFGAVDNLIYERTIFSIFSPFLPEKVVESIISEMREGGYSRIKNYLGLRASSISTIAPLKACPTCMRNNSDASSAVAWWHIEHQFPTVRLCPTHGDQLLIASEKFHSSGLKDWYLPTDLRTENWCKINQLSDNACSKLHNLCNWTIRLCQEYHQHFDLEILRLTYHLHAKSLGLTSLDGTLNLNKFRQAFWADYKCLENLTGFSFLRETSQDNGGFIGSILFDIGTNKHPLRHLFIMEFLFSNPDTLFSAYERVLYRSTMSNKNELWSEILDSRALLRLLVSDIGLTANEAAKRLGITRIQAINFLQKEGITCNRPYRRSSRSK